MWAQGNQWNQMSLDAASYQNVNHEHVDWASLAQQWIQMKEVHETVVLNTPDNHHGMQLYPPPNPYPIESGVVGGEAPMDVEKEDEHQPAPPTGLNWSWPLQNIHQQPQMQNWPQQLNPSTPRPPFLQGLPPGPPIIPQNFMPTGIPHHLPRIPLLPMPRSKQGGNLDEDSNVCHPSMSVLDAAKRKNLPAWIREGLEKMEREKQKKEERERFLEEREQIRKMRLEEQQKNNPSISRFDDSEPEEIGPNDDREEEDERPSFSLKSSETLLDMMSVIRKLMTEILLEVTSEEILTASVEVCQRSKVKSRPALQSSLPSKSLTHKLGLDQYGSESEESDGDDDEKSAVETQKQDSETRPDGKVEAHQDADNMKSLDETLLNSGSGTITVVANTNSGIASSGTKVETDISNKIANGNIKESVKKVVEPVRRRSRSRSRRKSRSRSPREKSRSFKKRSRSRERKHSRSRSRRSRSRSRSRRSTRRSRSRDRRGRRSRSRSKDRRKR